MVFVPVAVQLSDDPRMVEYAEARSGGGVGVRAPVCVCVLDVLRKLYVLCVQGMFVMLRSLCVYMCVNVFALWKKCLCVCVCVCVKDHQGIK